ncbi:MAG: ferric reductase-like transmembrane domain-containing protein [Austwickia sp.]|nr:ferric reductase-like transmembrane domain-containing protein [Austwickia sp.]
MSSLTRTPPAGLAPPAPRFAPWWKDAAGALVWLSLLAVVAMWLAGGGLSGLTGTAAAITSLGRLTALLAANLMLLQVLLLARIPAVERSFGQDELVRSHRQLGFASFTLMVAHVGLILLGYAGARLDRLVPVTVEVALDLPGMLLAVAGTACLVMVVVTSVRRTRAALRYESWHLLHLYAYLGVFLALPHQLWTGTDLLANPVATAYWWTVWLAAAGSVLVWRVVVPLVLSRRHDLRVQAVHDDGDGVHTVVVTGRHLARLRVAAGQFFTWRFLDGPGWTRGHPYSLSAAPDGRTLAVSVAAVGDGSARVATLRPRTRVLIEGPYGRMHPGVRRRTKVALIAAGIGIAPMKALIEALEVAPGELSVLHRVSCPDTVPLHAKVAAAVQARGGRLLLLPGPRRPDAASWLPQRWEHGSDAAALRRLLPDIAEHDVYVCGPPGWLDLVVDALAEAGVPDGQIHRERFAW